MPEEIVLTLAALSTALQLGVLSVLVRGRWREFPTLAVYLVGMFAATVVSNSLYFERGAWSAGMSRYYWVLETCVTILLTALVLSFVQRALDKRPSKAPTVRLVIGGAILVTAGSILYELAASHAFGMLMANVTRNLGFWVAVANLVLWMKMIGGGEFDRTVLMLSGGIGLQSAGHAIATSLTILSYNMAALAYYAAVVSHLLCLLIWLKALRAAPKRPRGDALKRPAAC
ncbi:MAG TPA: hypothetical protein DEH78_29825 [Solibacterales bacterium]|nr:hypothetical protein [Bryobacterales bacterium]